MPEVASLNGVSKHDGGAPTRARIGRLAVVLAIAVTLAAAGPALPLPIERPTVNQPDGPIAQRPVSASINAITREIALPPELEWPNGIAFDGRNRLLVGAITEPKILRFEDDAWTVTEIAAPGVFSVTSLTYDGERDLIWGTSPAFLDKDSDRRHGLYALHGENLEVVRFLHLPDGGFANDTEIASDGSLLVTDSVNGRVLAYNWARDEFRTLIEDERLRPRERVGAAGIATDRDGRIYIANFETGRLYVLIDGALRRIDLPRRLENPDGLALTGRGDLLAVEGAVQSGDGRLIRVPDPAEPGLRRVDILLDGLESPVNLVVDSNEAIYVTESRIRRRIGPTPREGDPDGFRVVVFGRSQ